MPNIIVFLKINQFYVRTQKIRLHPTVNVPLVVCKGGYVLDACHEAALSNVVAGIRTTLARRRCPALRVVEYDPADYAESSFGIWRQFAELTPLVEPVDERSGFLALTGCIPHGRSANELMTRRCLSVYERTGLLVDWGGGRDRWIARLACGENTLVEPENEPGLLKRFSVNRLGINDELCARLHRYGIRTVWDLQTTPRSFVESHLHVPGKELEPFLPRGDSAVQAAFPPPEIRLAVELDDGVDTEPERAVAELADRVERELNIGGRQAATLDVSVTDRTGVHERQVRLTKPVAARQNVYSLLLSTLTHLQPTNIRRIGLRLTQLSYRRSSQTDLWQRTTPRAEQLEQTTQTLARKFGTDTVQLGKQYAEQTPPRFAQLICRERGMFLP